MHNTRTKLVQVFFFYSPEKLVSSLVAFPLLEQRKNVKTQLRAIVWPNEMFVFLFLFSISFLLKRQQIPFPSAPLLFLILNGFNTCVCLPRLDRRGYDFSHNHEDKHNHLWSKFVILARTNTHTGGSGGIQMLLLKNPFSLFAGYWLL